MVADGIGLSVTANSTVKCCPVTLAGIDKHRQNYEKQYLMEPLEHKLSAYVDVFGLALESALDHPDTDCVHFCPEPKGNLVNVVHAILSALARLVP